MVLLPEGEIIRYAADTGHISVVEQLPYSAEDAEQSHHRQCTDHCHMVAPVYRHIDREEEKHEREQIGIGAHHPEQKIPESVSQPSADAKHADKDQH